MSAAPGSEDPERPDVDQKDLARTSRSEPLCLPNTSDQRRGHALAGRRTMSGLSDMFPLHDVKHPPASLTARANCSLTPDMSRERRRGSWWSQTGSNRRPHACKARALPTELWPHLGGPRGGRGQRDGWWAWDDSNVRPHPYQGCALTT